MFYWIEYIVYYRFNSCSFRSDMISLILNLDTWFMIQINQISVGFKCFNSRRRDYEKIFIVRTSENHKITEWQVVLNNDLYV